MRESELLTLLNDKMGLDLESTKEDKYCSYDAYDDKYTVELKCRRKHYSTQLIEELKLKHLHKGKELLYVVSTPEGVYAFNVSKLLEADYDFGWHTRKLPATTDFGRTEWIDKKVGYIDVNQSIWEEL